MEKVAFYGPEQRSMLALLSASAPGGARSIKVGGGGGRRESRRRPTSTVGGWEGGVKVDKGGLVREGRAGISMTVWGRPVSWTSWTCAFPPFPHTLLPRTIIIATGSAPGM